MLLGVFDSLKDNCLQEKVVKIYKDLALSLIVNQQRQGEKISVPFRNVSVNLTLSEKISRSTHNAIL